MAKEKKQRPAKYVEKLATNGTFDDLIKVSVNYTPPKKAKKAAKKKKWQHYEETAYHHFHSRNCNNIYFPYLPILCRISRPKSIGPEPGDLDCGMSINVLRY